jgi:hypothetical protein
MEHHDASGVDVLPTAIERVLNSPERKAALRQEGLE